MELEKIIEKMKAYTQRLPDLRSMIPAYNAKTAFTLGTTATLLFAAIKTNAQPPFTPEDFPFKPKGIVLVTDIPDGLELRAYNSVNDSLVGTAHTATVDTILAITPGAEGVPPDTTWARDVHGHYNMVITPEFINPGDEIYFRLTEEGIIYDLHSTNEPVIFKNGKIERHDLEKGSISAVGDELPQAYSILYPIFPNPFNPITTIRYDLEKEINVLIEVYNISGQKVRTLVDAPQGPGEHTTTFNAEGLSSGLYFFTVKAGTQTSTVKGTYAK